MVFDLHNDLLTSGSPAIWRTVRDTVDTVVYAFYTSELAHPMRTIARDALRLRENGKPFSVEDLGFADDRQISEICALSPAYCSLTHNAANALAGGALQDAPLTKRGKRAIAEMNRAGVAADTAHLGASAFFAVAECAERLIDSHTGLRCVCDHPRNVSDEQVRAILARGGIVGLTAVRSFLDGDDAQAYVRTIDTFVQKFGIDGACIGTDFFGTEPLRDLRGYSDFYRVAQELGKRGYTDAEIDKILYNNAKTYFSQERTFI